MDQKTKKKKMFKSSYIGRNRHFLKNWEDFTLEHSGKPLNEFIASDFHWKNGVLFNEKVVTGISAAISSSFLSQEPEEEEEMCIQESEIFFIVYTQCQIDDVVLFFVWHFETHMVTEYRDAWEARYGLVPGTCCLKNSVTFSSLESRQGLEGNPNQEALADRKTQKCQFQNEYVACHATVFPHFVNPENPKAAEFLKKHPLNIPVNMDMTFGPLKDTPAFCYGGHKLGLCNSLYDSIIYDDTYQGKGEHNLKKFFSEAIATCFLYQNAIKPINYKPKNIKHSVIGVSLYY